MFVDIDWDTAADRLLKSKRETENVQSLMTAKQTLIDRWNTENNRYQELYKTDNTNLKNYDLVIKSDRSIEDLSEIIYKKYMEFIEK